MRALNDHASQAIADGVNKVETGPPSTAAAAMAYNDIPSRLYFITLFDAALEKAVQPYLDNKYGVGQYRLSWSSDGSGTGADIEAVSQALPGMGIQGSLSLLFGPVYDCDSLLRLDAL
ncbi:hypothetical protein PG996_002204 [Apiospora saccharicola]|uniref:Uncharacterized protein n=1 Tax=Apiospora saccharicola TaxID=335842 RepID=A0ABR1WIZ0_9PEZI